MDRHRYQSWGRFPRHPGGEIELDLRNLPSLSGGLRGKSVLPFGNGRSYGDVCLNSEGVLLDTRRLNKFIEFDKANGSIKAEAGVLLSDINRVITPHGWFLPVTPGTQFITLGGAVANDVHGKNHHRAGCFGSHIKRFELLRSDGARLVCSPNENARLFDATIGGLGLTGLISWVEIALMKVSGANVLVESIPFVGLENFLELSSESEDSYEYTVAWVDCLATGARFGRGIFARGNHIDTPPMESNTGGRLSMPFTPPFSLVRPFVVRVFNACYYRIGCRGQGPQTVPYAKFFYPLDSIRNWNRIYGSKGFLQYQFVVPMKDARHSVEAVLRALGETGNASFLAVMKVFGSRKSRGIMSFPRPGVTLAVDLPIASNRVFSVLDRLDCLVRDAGGVVYPAKDARMSAESFRTFFPEWPLMQNYVDNAFQSDFIRRVGG